MVKLVIDFLGNSIGKEVLALKNTIIIITPKCEIPEGFELIYKELNDVNKIMGSESFFFRTSDDFLRGIIIGQVILKSPNYLIYSSRPEVLQKYFKLSAKNIESWPNSFNSYNERQNITLKGPPVELINPFSASSSRFSTIPPELMNFQLEKTPRIAQEPTVMNYVQPKDFESERQSTSPMKISSSLASNSRLNQSEIKAQTKRREYELFKTEEEVEPPFNQQSKEFVENLHAITYSITDNPELFNVKSIEELYSLIFKAIREYAKTEKDVIKSDTIRFYYEKSAMKSILGLGLFNIQSGKSIDEIVENQEYRIRLEYLG